jgi:hypothetical protein
MTCPRLILYAFLLVVGLALGADSFTRWCKPATIPKPEATPSTTCPHCKFCPYCQGWEAFDAGEPVSDNPYPSPSIPNDPTSPWMRWKWGWEGRQRNRILPMITAVA